MISSTIQIYNYLIWKIKIPLLYNLFKMEHESLEYIHILFYYQGQLKRSPFITYSSNHADAIINEEIFQGICSSFYLPFSSSVVNLTDPFLVKVNNKFYDSNTYLNLNANYWCRIRLLFEITEYGFFLIFQNFFNYLFFKISFNIFIVMSKSKFAFI